MSKSENGSTTPNEPQTSRVQSRIRETPIAIVGMASLMPDAKAVDRYCDASMMLDDLERGSQVAFFDSLFEKLEPEPENSGTSMDLRRAIQLGFAFARLVPWLLGFTAVLIVTSRLAC